MRIFKALLVAALVLAITVPDFAIAGVMPTIPQSKTITAATSATAGTGVSFTGPVSPLWGSFPTPGSRIGPRRVVVSCTATAAAYFEGTVTFYSFLDNGGFAGCRDLANLAGGSLAIPLRGWEGQQTFDFIGDGPDSASIAVSAGTTPKVLFRW